jgi:hypothetical protein
MPKRMKKHPIEMTGEELAAHVFHPKVLKAAKKQISVLESPKTLSKPLRKSAL